MILPARFSVPAAWLLLRLEDVYARVELAMGRSWVVCILLDILLDRLSWV